MAARLSGGGGESRILAVRVSRAMINISHLIPAQANGSGSCRGIDHDVM
jgi:hypothetical protein